ncbi:hypothetical protein Tco_1146224 [Tanacetum coccineum]
MSSVVQRSLRRDLNQLGDIVEPYIYYVNTSNVIGLVESQTRVHHGLWIKPFRDDGKKVDEDPRKESESNDQEKEDNVNSTNNVNVVGTNEVNAISGKTSIKLSFDPNMPALEDYSIFDFLRDDKDDGAVADMKILDTTIQVGPILTIRIHKYHPFNQVIVDLQSATQTRKISKNLEDLRFVSYISKTCMLLLDKVVLRSWVRWVRVVHYVLALEAEQDSGFFELEKKCHCKINEIVVLKGDQNLDETGGFLAPHFLGGRKLERDASNRGGVDSDADEENSMLLSGDKVMVLLVLETNCLLRHQQTTALQLLT